jgi:hypothetical protein
MIHFRLGWLDSGLPAGGDDCAASTSRTALPASYAWGDAGPAWRLERRLIDDYIRLVESLLPLLSAERLRLAIDPAAYPRPTAAPVAGQLRGIAITAQ